MSDTLHNGDRRDETNETVQDASPEDASVARLTELEPLREAGKLATARKVMSYIAHELGTPLNVIQARAQMVASGEFTGEAALKSARSIAEQAARMTTILRQSLKHIEESIPPKRAAPADLLDIAKAAVALGSASAAARGVRVALDPASRSVRVVIDAPALLEAVMNLLLNGVQATSQGGTVTLAVHKKVRPREDIPNETPFEVAALEIRDEGVGIPQSEISEIWRPFFTTKGALGCVGLGLSIAQKIVKEHGGWIGVESFDGRGSSFTVYLPRGDT